jgi:penicillin-binding protein 1A
MPKQLFDVVVAAEDKRFWEHQGVDWKRTAGAFVNMFIPIYSSSQGGSTLPSRW